MNTVLFEDEKAQLLRLKQYFPFRICWAAKHPETLEFIVNATTTMHKPNAYARKGYAVIIARSGA